MNHLRNVLFGTVMILYLWYPYSMITRQEHILELGSSYRFKLRPIDPVDAFRGRYILLAYENNMSIDYPNAPQFFNYGQEVFVDLAVDKNGYAYFSSINTDVPNSDNYLRTTCNGTRPNSVSIQIPPNMEKYFLNESIAPEAERIYMQRRQTQSGQDSVLVYVDTKVYQGNALLEQLYFQDQTVEDYIRSQQNN